MAREKRELSKEERSSSSSTWRATAAMVAGSSRKHMEW
jgi:hypothetical protein